MAHNLIRIVDSKDTLTEILKAARRKQPKKQNLPEAKPCFIRNIETKSEHYCFASVIFCTISKNTQVNMIPFIIVVVVSAHHIPRIPNALLLKMIASGMRSDVKAMLIPLHRRVLPNPDNAPTVIISTHKNASLNPTMIK